MLIQTIMSKLSIDKGVIDTYTHKMEYDPIIDQLKSPMSYVAIAASLLLQILLVVLVVFGILYACQLIRRRRTDA